MCRKLFLFQSVPILVICLDLMKLSIETMVKAKKWVVCLGYSGRGYYGMQAQRR